MYVGSGTNKTDGIKARADQYKNSFLACLFIYTEASLKEGFSITHFGMSFQIPLPTAANVLLHRHFILAVEATLAFTFWTMKSRTKLYNMGRMCLWDISLIGYDGLCSHSSMREGVLGIENNEALLEELERMQEFTKQRRNERKVDYRQENRENINEVHRTMRIEESKEKREKRLARRRELHAIHRSTMTEERKKELRERDAEETRRRRANKTEEQAKEDRERARIRYANRSKEQLEKDQVHGKRQYRYY